MRHFILALLVAGCSAANSSEVSYHFSMLAPMSCDQDQKFCHAYDPSGVEVDHEGVTYSLRMRQSCGPTDCTLYPVAPAYCTNKGCEVTIAALTPSDPGPGHAAAACGGECPKGCDASDMNAVCFVPF